MILKNTFCKKLVISTTAFLVAALSNHYTEDNYQVVAKTAEVEQLIAYSPNIDNQKTKKVLPKERSVSNEKEFEKTELEVCPHNLFYTYMYANSVTDVNSSQYKLIQESYIGDYGIYMKDNAYLVAMGTKYAQYIGQKFEIVFENGNEIEVIVGDVKQDIHTMNGNKCTGINNNDILEFIVSDSLDETAKNWGSLHAIEKFNSLVSNIRSIE